MFSSWWWTSILGISYLANIFFNKYSVQYGIPLSWHGFTHSSRPILDPKNLALHLCRTRSETHIVYFSIYFSLFIAWQLLFGLREWCTFAQGLWIRWRERCVTHTSDTFGVLWKCINQKIWFYLFLMCVYLCSLFITCLCKFTKAVS